MSKPDYDVIVVGAGPVGVTLAWRLLRSGLSVRVLEAESAPVEQLRASTFHPPTLDMLTDDGISDELIAAGRITPTWQIRMHATDERAEFDLSVLRDDTDYPYRLQCRQEVLVQACLTRINRLQPDVVRFGCKVRTVMSDALSAQVQYADADNHQQSLMARWVVGCDGARSVVREQSGIAFEGDTYPEHTILATTAFPFEDHLAGLSGVNYIWSSDSTFSLLRLPDCWRCSFHPRPGQTPEQALSIESILQQLAAVTPLAAQTTISDRRIYRVHHRLAAAYRVGRVFLAGDAAHLNSPKGGMGMNGGIHDAFELAEILSSATDLRESALPVLGRYERRRRPVALNDIVTQADQNRARMAEMDPVARENRLRNLQAIAADKDKMRRFLLRSSMIDGLRKSRAVQ